MDIRIGADPEFFVSYKKQLVSAHGLVPGTKENPFIVKDGAVQVDGMALEININPATSSKEFCKNILSVMKQLKEMVPNHEFLLEAAVHFKEEYLRGQPEEVRKLGCDPDFNAYTNEINPSPNADQTLRTAAGHIHIGWCEGADVQDAGHVDMCIQLVKQLDLFLGVPSILWDECAERRILYGKAGAFRPKPYGVEYRVLSNAWITSEYRMEWVYKRTIAAVNELMVGCCWYENILDAEKCINNNDINRAHDICREMEHYGHEVA